MFERYTEKAGRVIFFGRYEASQFGSSAIDVEHLLLGLLREEKHALRWIPKAQSCETLRQQIENWIVREPPIPPSVDLPLSNASKHVLNRAKDEAERLNSRHIGTEHLFLALLQEPDSRAAKLLLEFGADLGMLRGEFAKQAEQQYSSITDLVKERIHQSVRPIATIHGTQRSLRPLLEAATVYRQQNCFWRKRSWTAQDAVMDKKTGKLSLDLSAAADTANFELLKGGWKKDHCGICRWELFETAENADHGTAYTNGRDWVCTECYETFWSRPDFISGSYSDLT
jgi:hypothetical protein